MSRSLLFPTHEFSPVTGGAARYVEETAAAAARAGFEVQVWAPDHPTVDDQKTSFTIRRFPLQGNQNWPDRMVLRRALRDTPIDWKSTTLCLAEPGPLRLWIYARELNLPRPERLVIVLHGSEILRLARWPHRRRRFTQLLEQADTIGVVSTGIRNLLLQKFPVDTAKLAIVPGGLSHAFTPVATRALSTNSAEASLRVLTVGRVDPRKGQLAVLEAITLLPESLRERVVYRLVGRNRRPTYTESLHAFAKRHAIRLEGPIEVSDSDLPNEYAAADLFVLASEPQSQSVEGFGLVYLEAAACQLPVIGQDTGGVRDAIGPENGIVTPLGDRAALSRAIAHLLESPERRATMGTAGPDWASRFSWERNVQTLFRSPHEIR